MTFGFLITLCAAMQVGGCVSSPGPQTPENELEQAMVRLFEFHVPGMCNITPTVRVDYGGRATGAPYLFPRTGRVWTSGNGAVEIWAECFALRDDTATRRYLKEHVGSDAPIDHTPSRAAIGDAVRAGQTYGYVDVAYGRFVVNVSRLYRNLDQADGATPALVPDMVESVARAVAYSLLRAGLVKDGRTGAAAAGGGRAPATVAMNGVVWTTLPALRAAGARVQARKDGLEIRIEHVGATATIRPYRAVASTPDGKEYALGVPVFVGIDGPMVPLHALAKALRCQARVSAKGVSFR